jgi:hypothetical protein
MLLDSNLIIYASRPEHKALRMFIARDAPYVSVISMVETPGNHAHRDDEQRFLEEFFDASTVLPVSQSSITVAIRLRQERRMSLGDALIAGIAMSQDMPLATHNVDDFAWIEELTVVDPLSA